MGHYKITITDKNDNVIADHSTGERTAAKATAAVIRRFGVFDGDTITIKLVPDAKDEGGKEKK